MTHTDNISPFLNVTPLGVRYKTTPRPRHQHLKASLTYFKKPSAKKKHLIAQGQSCEEENSGTS